jgi:hypothetical protein
MSFFLSTHSTYCMQIVTPNNFLYYSYACPNYSTVVKYCNNDDSTTLVVKLFWGRWFLGRDDFKPVES